MTAKPQIVGNVQQLWRYPVKSMLGERCESLDLDTRGVAGDRIYAVRDADGKFGSGKNTRRLRKLDGLLALQATFDEKAVTIRFPNGRALRVADPALASELTRELGHAVTLADCTEMPLVDAAAVHLLTTGALAWLQTALPDAGIDARRFRPNLVIDTGNHAPIEHAWVDKAIRIGDTATLRVIERTERCGMVAMAQSELPDDPRVLRHITEYVGLEFGVYGEVLAAGRVRTGDSVTLLD